MTVQYDVVCCVVFLWYCTVLAVYSSYRDMENKAHTDTDITAISLYVYQLISSSNSSRRGEAAKRKSSLANQKSK